MKLNITYDEANNRYNKLVVEVMSQLEKGKSKEKSRKADDPEFRWELKWSQAIRDVSFRELLENPLLGTERDSPPELTEEGVRIFLDDSIYWCLCGRVGRWWGNSSSSNQNIPAEIIAFYLNSYTEKEQEQAVIDAMSPEERGKEVATALAQLRKHAGFIEMNILPGDTG
jgi:hypothetical protein